MQQFQSPLRVIGWVRATFVAAMVVSVFGSLHAQEIRIRVVDGRNGKPVTSECVNVWVGFGHGNSAVLPTDRDGVAVLRLVENDTNAGDRQRGHACSGWATISPVLNYDDTIKITADYFVPCQAHPADSSWLSFSVKKILESGDFTTNACGKIEASPKPGELVFFVRPRSFLERLRQ